jgi:hypothetical protein
MLKIIKRREGICHLWCEQSILSRRIRPRIETESREKSCAMKMKERELLWGKRNRWSHDSKVLFLRIANDDHHPYLVKKLHSVKLHGVDEVVERMLTEYWSLSEASEGPFLLVPEPATKLSSNRFRERVHARPLQYGGSHFNGNMNQTKTKKIGKLVNGW